MTYIYRNENHCMETFIKLSLIAFIFSLYFLHWHEFIIQDVVKLQHPFIVIKFYSFCEHLVPYMQGTTSN